MKISAIAEDVPQPSFNNEGVTVINDNPPISNSRREKGLSLKMQGERQYPRNNGSDSQNVGPRDPSAPVTTRLRPASFYSKINTFWRPNTPQSQSSSTNTDSQRRGRPVLVGDMSVVSWFCLLIGLSGN